MELISFGFWWVLLVNVIQISLVCSTWRNYLL